MLEICLDTVSAMLKLHLFSIINAISLLNKRFSRFCKSLKQVFAAHFHHLQYMLKLPQIILHNRPTLASAAFIITKEKKICKR